MERSSDFFERSRDYRLNWTPLSPTCIAITNLKKNDNDYNCENTPDIDDNIDSTVNSNCH